MNQGASHNLFSLKGLCLRIHRTPPNRLKRNSDCFNPFIYSAGQTLALPNWLVGPSYGVAMVLLLAFRVEPEERMMLEEFGKDYEAYMATTKRLVPGVW